MVGGLVDVPGVYLDHRQVHEGYQPRPLRMAPVAELQDRAGRVGGLPHPALRAQRQGEAAPRLGEKLDPRRGAERAETAGVSLLGACELPSFPHDRRLYHLGEDLELVHAGEAEAVPCPPSSLLGTPQVPRIDALSRCEIAKHRACGPVTLARGYLQAVFEVIDYPCGLLLPRHDAPRRVVHQAGEHSRVALAAA